MSVGRERPSEKRHATPPASTFLRGLTVGALVGAAIAGSVLVGRRRRIGHPASKIPPPKPPTVPT